MKSKSSVKFKNPGFADANFLGNLSVVHGSAKFAHYVLLLFTQMLLEMQTSVLRGGYQHHVIRINARSVSALMMNVHTLGNIATKLLVVPPVSEIMLALHSHASMAPRIDTGTIPIPASVLGNSVFFHGASSE